LVESRLHSVPLEGSAIDGMADCAAAGAPLSSPAPLAHRCAAAGLDSGPAAERSRDGLRVSQPGTERSNPFPSSRESTNFRSLSAT
jgi:hypothetical protein